MKNNSPSSGLLAVLFTGVLMGALDISIAGPALPAIEEALQPNPRTLGWIFSIYLLFNLLGISFFARMSDRYGRKRIYILAVAIFGFGSLIVTLSDSMAMLLTGRAIQGLGSSGIFPVASATIGDVFPPEKRGKALGLIGAVFGIAFIIGPVLAGIILKYFQWPFLFAINIPLSIILIVASLRLLPNRPLAERQPIDWKGMGSLGLMLGTFTLGISFLDHADLTSTLTISLPLLLTTIGFLGLFLMIERKASYPIINVSIFGSLQIRILSVIALGTGLSQSIFVYIPDFIIQVFQVSKHSASFMMIPAVLASAFGAPISGRLVDRIGSRLVVMAGLMLLATGFVLLVSLPPSHGIFYLTGSIFGFGLSFLVGSSLRYIMLNEVRPEERATTQGLVSIFISVGQMGGSAGIGALIASFGNRVQGYHFAFFGLGLGMFLLLPLAYKLRRRAEERARFQTGPQQVLLQEIREPAGL